MEDSSSNLLAKLNEDYFKLRGSTNTNNVGNSNKQQQLVVSSSDLGNNMSDVEISLSANNGSNLNNQQKSHRRTLSFQMQLEEQRRKDEIDNLLGTHIEELRRSSGGSGG